MRVKVLNQLISLAVALGLSACGTVGSNEFACPGRPPGVRCMSATDVYAATQTTDVVAPTSSDALGDDPRASTRPGREQSSAAQKDGREGETQGRPPRSAEPVVLPEVDKPIPIRTQAQVMRAWIAPWEDSQGRAHSGGYTFLEIETRRWLFGEPSMTEPVRYFSLQTSETKEPVGKDRPAPSSRAGTSERPRPNSPSPIQGAPNVPASNQEGANKR